MVQTGELGCYPVAFYSVHFKACGTERRDLRNLVVRM